MSSAPVSAAQSTFKVIITALPWVASMYTLYWLECGDIWTLDTAHRGKTSVIILLLGMGLTLLLFSRLFKRK